jgi:hypothetical protein
MLYRTKALFVIAVTVSMLVACTSATAPGARSDCSGVNTGTGTC